MASNPIQRRARQSFLVGFLIALVIMAVVVAFLFMRINSLNEEKEKMVIVDTTVYTLVDEKKSGDEITADDLVPTTISAVNALLLDTENYLTPSSFEYDETTGEPLKYFSKIDIPAGSVMIANMVYAEGEETSNDLRKIEYNMLVLPSQLSNGDYIDIRYKLPDGKDMIVLSRKRIEQCTEDTIWLDMKEEEILQMNGAIVDSYLVTGSMLYATIYKEPGMQSALAQTYVPSYEVSNQMTTTPNIVDEAKAVIKARWEAQNPQRQDIESYTEGNTKETNASTVEAGRQEEATKLETMRGDYVSALDGTGKVGTNY